MRFHWLLATVVFAGPSLCSNTPAAAQSCSGQMAANTICGNLTGAQRAAGPSATSGTSSVLRATGATATDLTINPGTLMVRGAASEVPNTPGRGVFPLGLEASFLSGTTVAPITSDTVTALVTRTQAIPTAGNFAGAFDAVSYGTDSGGAQSTAINGFGYQFGTGDALGVGAVGENHGTGYAYGMFALAHAAAGSSANGVGLEIVASNARGDFGYSRTGTSRMTGINLFYITAAGAPYLGGAGIQIYANGPGQWDVGLAFMQGDYIKTASIQDDTNSTHILYAASGAHTNGINLTGASFSGCAFRSGGFCVDGNGSVTSSNASGTYQYLLGSATRSWGIAVTSTGDLTFDDLTGGAQRFKILTSGIGASLGGANCSGAPTGGFTVVFGVVTAC